MCNVQRTLDRRAEILAVAVIFVTSFAGLLQTLGLCGYVSRWPAPTASPARPPRRCRTRGARHFAAGRPGLGATRALRSEEHTSELPSLMRISYAVFCLKKK